MTRISWKVGESPVVGILWWAALLAGFALLALTWKSLIGTLIVTRPHNDRISDSAAQLSTALFSLLRRPVKKYQTLDRLLAWQAPLTLFIRLAVWMVLFYFAFALMLVPFVHGDLARALSESGSGLFTLGYSPPAGPGSTTVVYMAAFTGLAVVALQIGYLPTLYAAVNRRESEVTLLRSRAGTPAWGPELLLRTRFGLSGQGSTKELEDLYRSWERWAADVAESHSTYLTLCWFRSPLPDSNWLIALLSVMDSAALQLSLSPSIAPTVRARLLLRMGFSCLQQIAAAISLPVNDDVDPDGETQLTFEEFKEAVSMLSAAGYPVEQSAEQAWPHFRGWRLNYEDLAYRLARTIDAPAALWSGPRRLSSAPSPPKRPANRVASDAGPDDPQRYTTRP
ncbi:hypothetical protein [Arthrobacter sp. lap29]|uniref:hypothetical protein n=1 Tax=Arthrobacter sp. lap29 TaxID=3056122 RepID=UPI0028F6F7E3|nr:hypothetical protein [Arthrobacter sp. lap29]